MLPFTVSALHARRRASAGCGAGWRERLFEYADQALDAPGEVAVRRHLASCAACRMELARMRSLAAAVRRTAAIVTAPASLRQRVGAELAAAAARQGVSRSPR